MRFYVFKPLSLERSDARSLTIDLPVAAIAVPF